MQFVFYLLATTILAQHDLADFKCPDNQHAVAVGCSSTEQCIPYTTEFVTCIDGACCIENNPDDLPYPIPPICSNGGIALAVDCTESQQCSPYTEEPVACLQGTCCTSFNILTGMDNSFKVPQKCPNDGHLVGLQCTTSQSCIPLAEGCPVICIDEMCCTVGDSSVKSE
uniref:CC domain-containing protein n=1 Tax=Onchocerca volvulus TaxID=6282 RepID=A0A8R1TZV2_ONCVO